MNAVNTTLNYSGSPSRPGPHILDYRKLSANSGSMPDQVACTIHDARATSDIGLEASGFELFQQRSAVQDWFNEAEVMSVYYEECRALAAKLTGASKTFTYDHLIREPDCQTLGGGLKDRANTNMTGIEGGGGYIHGIHMDYTVNSEWHEYLALHGETEPANPKRVIALNFWRPLVEGVIENNALAVCDARTVQPEDVTELMVYGYGTPAYSWHDIGISTYSVNSSPRHTWYYYPRMTRDEVLIIKSYDSAGVVGKTCPHTAFVNPDASPDAEPRRSIELRVLCFIT